MTTRRHELIYDSLEDLRLRQEVLNVDNATLKLTPTQNLSDEEGEELLDALAGYFDELMQRGDAIVEEDGRALILERVESNDETWTVTLVWEEAN